MELFWPTRPKYELAWHDFRRLQNFTIFLINLDCSDWLRQQYPKEMCDEAAIAYGKLNELSIKHCLLRSITPLRINSVLVRLRLPQIVIPLKHPLRMIAYANSAFDIMTEFYVKWCYVEESKFFWPDNCPERELLCTLPNRKFADGLHNEYKRALTR